MKRYAIRFFFPDDVAAIGGSVFYAGDYGGAAGFAPSLESAFLYERAEDAERFLENAYGKSSAYGHVVLLEPSLARRVTRRQESK